MLCTCIVVVLLIKPIVAVVVVVNSWLRELPTVKSYQPTRVHSTSRETFAHV